LAIHRAPTDMTTRLRYYQLSLRALLVLTALTAAGLWLALWWVGRITPQRGETLVTAREQRILATMKHELKLDYAVPPPLDVR
jgi:hypothetical protein